MHVTEGDKNWHETEEMCCSKTDNLSLNTLKYRQANQLCGFKVALNLLYTSISISHKKHFDIETKGK